MLELGVLLHPGGRGFDFSALMAARSVSVFSISSSLLTLTPFICHLPEYALPDCRSFCKASYLLSDFFHDFFYHFKRVRATAIDKFNIKIAVSIRKLPILPKV